MFYFSAPALHAAAVPVEEAGSRPSEREMEDDAAP